MVKIPRFPRLLRRYWMEQSPPARPVRQVGATFVAPNQIETPALGVALKTVEKLIDLWILMTQSGFFFGKVCFHKIQKENNIFRHCLSPEWIFPTVHPGGTCFGFEGSNIGSIDTSTASVTLGTTRCRGESGPTNVGWLDGRVLMLIKNRRKTIVRYPCIVLYCIVWYCIVVY